MPVVPAKPVVKTVTIKLDEAGYEGWYVVMRTNPKASVYDNFLSRDEEGKSWEALGQIIVEWNFVDDEGNLLALPPELNKNDLPYDVQIYMNGKYIEAFNDLLKLPKMFPSESETTSSTNAESLKNGAG